MCLKNTSGNLKLATRVCRVVLIHTKSSHRWLSIINYLAISRISPLSQVPRYLSLRSLYSPYSISIFELLSKRNLLPRLLLLATSAESTVRYTRKFTAWVMLSVSHMPIIYILQCAIYRVSTISVIAI